MKIALILFALMLNITDNPISFKDLIFAYENDLNSVTTKLNGMNFRFEKTEKSDNNEDVIVWKYDSSENKRISIFVGKFCFEPNCGHIHLQTDNEKVYSTLKSEAISNGFEYDKTEIGQYKPIDEIISHYHNNDYTLQMSEGKYKDGRGNLYSITLAKTVE